MIADLNMSYANNFLIQNANAINIQWYAVVKYNSCDPSLELFKY